MAAAAVASASRRSSSRSGNRVASPRSCDHGLLPRDEMCPPILNPAGSLLRAPLARDLCSPLGSFEAARDERHALPTDASRAALLLLLIGTRRVRTVALCPLRSLCARPAAASARPLWLMLRGPRCGRRPDLRIPRSGSTARARPPRRRLEAGRTPSRRRRGRTKCVSVGTFSSSISAPSIARQPSIEPSPSLPHSAHRTIALVPASCPCPRSRNSGDERSRGVGRVVLGRPCGSRLG
jgi:hypothetical protein